MTRKILRWLWAAVLLAWRVAGISIRWLARAAFLVIRTLNLWEPESFDHTGQYYPTISLSKLAMWGSFVLVYFVFQSDAGLASEIISGVVASGSVGNYAFRRHIQARTGTAGYRNRGLPDDGGEMEFEEEPLGDVVDPDSM